jgi:dTDP-glucose 4,6-dehydratase
VDDLIEGIWRLLVSELVGGPVNFGNPEEVKVLDLARTILTLVGSGSEATFSERPIDDPEIRCPDISERGRCSGGSPGSL